MAEPVATCEHCGTHFKVPLMAGAPISGHMPGGSIVCGHCGKRTRVPEAFVLHDPTLKPGELSYRVPAICPRCGFAFLLDFGDARAGAPTPKNIDMRCPRCHAQAIAQAGQYDAIEGGT